MAARWSLRVAVAALVVAAATALTQAEETVAKPPARKPSYHDFRRDIFAISKVRSASIVMLGDSITEAGPWDELTGCRSMANRGIGGDTTAGVLARLDDVVKLRPRALFLMIGVNDVALGVPRERTVENYRRILDRLDGPDFRTFVAYVLPVAKSYAKWRNNESITTLNTAIAGLIAGRANVTAIDLRPLVSDHDGFLREDLSYDGLHPSAKGYAIWRDAIAAEVTTFCAP
ncbi:MAG TPA: GDSL-type esterase/lipase family protein [Xanthobacteraceae bacterium]|jgi:lysophospholipase L1-like esterase|nr:GDSL-type esterase/lipase family protein [Xanthobacteraceae bacterium]